MHHVRDGERLLRAPRRIRDLERRWVAAVRHGQPEDVAKEIGDALPLGTVVVADKSSGTLVVEGDAATLARARSLVAALDSASPTSGGTPATRSYRLRFTKPDDVVAKLKVVVPGGAFSADDQLNAVIVTGAGQVQLNAADLIANVNRASPK